MKKILFPTDFSAIANNAFLYALKMADTLEAEIVLLHTFDLPIIDNAEMPMNFKEIYDTLEVQQMSSFKDHIPNLKEIASLNNLEHIRLSHILKSGDLIYAMKETVVEQNISLVVMGTSGTSNWFETLLGSNAGEALTMLPVPVLSIPFETKYHKIKTIAFTTLYREKDMTALKRVMDIAEKLNASVKCLYVKKSSSDITDDQIALWEARCKQWPIQFFVIPHNNVRETIEDFLHSQHIDLLTILTEKRGFFEDLFSTSLTQKLSYQLDVPIMALHEED